VVGLPAPLLLPEDSRACRPKPGWCTPLNVKWLLWWFSSSEFLNPKGPLVRRGKLPVLVLGRLQADALFVPVMTELLLLLMLAVPPFMSTNVT
jgi:hypothetical protein